MSPVDGVDPFKFNVIPGSNNTDVFVNPGNEYEFAFPPLPETISIWLLTINPCDNCAAIAALNASTRVPPDADPPIAVIAKRL
jgi:hypothetical protein